MEVVFLGTSSMVPTKERNQSAVFISYGSEGLLIDCGEGTQRQLKIAGIPLTKVTRILITHWHGDHVLGLPGLIQSLGASEYGKVLQIYGPEGTKKRVAAMFEAFVFDRKLEIKLNEIKGGIFFENEEFILGSALLDHGIVTLGYFFIEKEKRKVDIKKVKALGIPHGPLIGKLQKNLEISYKGRKIIPDEVTHIVKGKKIAIISDTVPCNGCYTILRISQKKVKSTDI